MEPVELIALAWANREAILSGAAYVIATAASLAAVTPSAKDDKILSRLLSIVDVLALNVGGARNEVPKIVEPSEKFKAAKDVGRLIRHAVKGK